MKLAVVSMIRDEADILPAFLRHIDTVFDIGILFDHRSSDGSSDAMRNFCDGRENWCYFFLDFAGRHQSQVSTLGLKQAFARGADAVFFLDADEFVILTTCAEIKTLVRQLNVKRAVGALRWIPCYPQTFAASSFDPVSPVWVAKSPADVRKVVIPRSLYEHAGSDLTIAEGNHFVFWDGVWHAPKLDIGFLYHLPVRSRQQIIRKGLIGAVSNLAKMNSMHREDFQQRQLADMIAEDRLDQASLASMARFYGESRVDTAREFVLDTLDCPFTDRRIDLGAEASDIRILARAICGVRFEVIGREALRLRDGVVTVDPRKYVDGLIELQTRVVDQTARLDSVRFLSAKLVSRVARRIKSWARRLFRRASGHAEN
jgi:hypothetical protein